MIPDIEYRNEHAREEFVSTAMAVMAGAAIGTYIDRHTRIGHWANTSPTADKIVRVIKGLAVLVAVGLAALYVYCFLTTS